MNLLEEMESREVKSGQGRTAQTSTVGRIGTKLESAISYTVVQIRSASPGRKHGSTQTKGGALHRVLAWPSSTLLGFSPGAPWGEGKKSLPPRKSLAKQLQPDTLGQGR